MELHEPLPSQDTPYEDDPPLRTQVLLPYKPQCRYLKSARITDPGEPRDNGRAVCSGEFDLPESCYIDSTGHFNAVEFNICYNQLGYYLFAKAIQEGLMKPFAGWTLDDYWKRQLSHFLIIDFHSTFRRALTESRFSGEFSIVGIREREASATKRALILVDTECRFWDESGGDCSGSVKLAIPDPPLIHNGDQAR